MLPTDEMCILKLWAIFFEHLNPILHKYFQHENKILLNLAWYYNIEMATLRFQSLDDLPCFFFPFLSLIIECSRRKVGDVRRSSSTAISLTFSPQQPPDSGSLPLIPSHWSLSSLILFFESLTSGFPTCRPLPFQMDLGILGLIRNSFNSMKTKMTSRITKDNATNFSRLLGATFSAGSPALEEGKIRLHVRGRTPMSSSQLRQVAT